MYYFLMVLACVILDQLTKMLIVSSFALYESLEIIPGFFNLVYAVNKGAAFSMLADIDSPWRHYFFIGVSGVAVIGISVYYFQTRIHGKLYGLALALICGGAAGNLVDRIRLGYVIDFLDFYIRSYHWPAFNVADTSICLGAALFLLVSLQHGKKQEEGG